MNETLNDIRGPVAIPDPWLWFWIVVGFFVFGGAALFVWFRLRKKVSGPVLPALPPVPPWETALAALDALGKEDWIGEERTKAFYSRLSEVVRLYVEARFEIRAPEMTTEEFLESARASAALPENYKPFLKDFLTASDLVKFARFVPTPGDRVEAIDLAKKFVVGTCPAVGEPKL